MKTKTLNDVIIVGGGVSGLAAANYLLRNGIHSILILEGREKVGGRIETVSFEDHQGRIELGAQWIHGEESEFCCLVKNSDHRHAKTSWEGRGDFLLPNGEKEDPTLIKEVLSWVEHKIEFVEETFTISTLQNNSDYLNNKTSENMGRFLKHEFHKQVSTQGLAEGSPEYERRMALFQWAMSFQRIDNSCNQMANLSLYRWSEFEVCPGEHYNNFKEGASSFIDNVLVKSIPSEAIKLHSQVIEIFWNKPKSLTDRDRDLVEIHTKDGRVYYTRCVLVTCSIGVLKEAISEQKKMFQPELPLSLRTAINSTGFGPIGKVFLKWNDPWWPPNNKESYFEGFQLLWPKKYIDCCDDQEEIANTEILNERWIKSFTGFDPVLDSPQWLLGWLGGPEAKFVETISETEVGDKVAQLLSQFTGVDVPKPDQVYVSKWNNDEFFRGAYSYRSVEGDKVTGDICSILSEPVMKSDSKGNDKPVIFLAGEALSKTHYSTLHGAYESGEEQAAKIVKLLQADFKSNMKSVLPNGMPKVPSFT